MNANAADPKVRRSIWCFNQPKLTSLSTHQQMRNAVIKYQIRETIPCQQ